jgi:hypothetical protein
MPRQQLAIEIISIALLIVAENDFLQGTGAGILFSD